MDEAMVLRGWLEVGTSWGLFRSELEEMAAVAVVEAVRFALPEGLPVLPLARWAEREQDLLRRRTLEATVAFYHQCRELHRLTLEARAGEELERFGRLYLEVARLGTNRRHNLWNAIPQRVQDSPGALNSEVPSGRWVRDRWVELVLAEGARRAAVVERVRARLNRPLPGVESWLPADPAAARPVLLQLLDLALMAPAGQVYGTVPGPWLPAALLPGWRLLTAAAVLRKGSASPRGEGWIEALCEERSLRWPDPAWLSYKARELPPPRVKGLCAVRLMQRTAADLRCRIPEGPANSPAVFRVGRRALVARRRAALVAAGVKVWIKGTLPGPSPALAIWPLKRYHHRLARTFDELFRLPLDSLVPEPPGAGVPSRLRSPGTTTVSWRATP